MTPVIAGTLGIVAGLALWTALAVLLRSRDAVVSGDPAVTAPARVSRWAARAPWARIGAAGAAGAVIWFLTGWPVATAGATVLAWFGPVLFGGDKAFKAELARVDGIAAWAESLRDVISAAAGLEQALQRSAAHPPPAIAVDVRQLATDLKDGRGIEAGLREFAARLDDETVDLVCMALIVASRQAGNLAPVLDALARTARAEAAMRMRVHTMRARSRTATRVIIAATVAMMVLLLMVAGDYLAPYGTLTGQLMLACAFALFGFGLWWLHRLAAPETAPSFLRVASSRVQGAQS
jgi:Flp pilus assembly protein TadB